MKKNKLISTADLSLVLVAIIWGTGFIATEYAIKSGMGTSLIMALRFTIAAVTLLIFCLKELKQIDKKTILHGSVAGGILFLGFYSQTFGQAHTNVSNSAFLTATNVVMVPFIVWIISRKSPGLKTYILAFTTLIGIGILTLKFDGSGFSLGMGDVMTLFCALCFAMHIAYLGIFGKNLNAKLLAFMQLFVAAIISIATLLLFDIDTIDMQVISKGLLPILYLAIFSTCLCYFIQTKAQQHTNPSKAGIILSTEGLFGSLFSVVFGLEPLTINIVIGGLIILNSVILMESNLKIFKKNK
ncbi:MAG: DMT family transporter [Oscillospiraceae bacterium]